MRRKSLVLAVAVLMVGVLLPFAAPAAAEKSLDTSTIRPIIYFHGGGGSAAQFESQAMRFASNGYPADYLTSFEYSTAQPVPDKEAMNARLDAFIDDILAKTGAGQVDIFGKTWPGAYPRPSYPGITMEYMASSPARRAKIAHACYNDSALSGYTALVPTLGIWAGLGVPGRAIIGATNIVLPLHTHVQTCTSPDTFEHAYRFFTGKEPATKDIVPEPKGQIRLAGRAILHQSNEAVQDATLEIWKVDGSTGRRTQKKPEAVYNLSGDGSWGPFKAKGGVHYEFALVREGQTHHFYYEPFIRSNFLMRLTTVPLAGGLGAYIDRSDRHSTLTVLRNKEILGDQGVNNDVLTINGVNVATPSLCPLGRRVIAFFAFDKGSDGASNLGAILPPFNVLSFMSAADLYIPAADPPLGTISVEMTPRGGDGRKQVVNVPNWQSSKHMITVQFNDFVQDANTWVDYVQSR